MRAKRIFKLLNDGKTVVYTVRRLRGGYLHGPASLWFLPEDAQNGLNNIEHKLKCFRFDEKPYDRPKWEAREELVEQLVSSDGTVLSQKVDGKWQDV